MMTEELRDAAERCADGWGLGRSQTAPALVLQELVADAKAVARAYRAEHPDDEDESANSTWLKSVGATRPMQAAAGNFYTFGEFRITEDDQRTGCYALGIDMIRVGPNRRPVITVTVFGRTVLITPTLTRGHVRRLAAALGIPLRESEAAHAD